MVIAGRNPVNTIQSRSWHLSIRFNTKQRFILRWNIKHNLRLFLKSQINLFLRQVIVRGIFAAIKVLHMPHCRKWTQTRCSFGYNQRSSIKRESVYNTRFRSGANIIGNHLLPYLQTSHCLALGLHFKTLFWILSPWFLSGLVLRWYKIHVVHSTNCLVYFLGNFAIFLYRQIG